MREEDDVADRVFVGEEHYQAVYADADAERRPALDVVHPRAADLDDADPRKPYFDRILEEEELTLEQFKLKGFKTMFFSKGERAAWCFPHDLEARDARDEEHPRKRKLTLHFDLPRGSYATLVVKRVTRVDGPHME